MFEPLVFRKQMYCIEESTCDIAETSAPPQPNRATAVGAHIVIRCPGNCAPLPPLVTPLLVTPVTKLLPIN